MAGRATAGYEEALPGRVARYVKQFCEDHHWVEAQRMEDAVRFCGRTSDGVRMASYREAASHLLADPPTFGPWQEGVEAARLARELRASRQRAVSSLPPNSQAYYGAAVEALRPLCDGFDETDHGHVHIVIWAVRAAVEHAGPGMHPTATIVADVVPRALEALERDSRAVRAGAPAPEGTPQGTAAPPENTPQGAAEGTAEGAPPTADREQFTQMLQGGQQRWQAAQDDDTQPRHVGYDTLQRPDRLPDDPAASPSPRRILRMQLDEVFRSLECGGLPCTLLRVPDPRTPGERLWYEYCAGQYGHLCGTDFAVYDLAAGTLELRATGRDGDGNSRLTLHQVCAGVMWLKLWHLWEIRILARAS